MKPLLMLFAIWLLQPLCHAADSYSIEATITPLRHEGQYEAVARVCRLVDRNGVQTEELLSKPRIVSSAGETGSFYVGPDRNNSNYKKVENISMQVVWPKENQPGAAICTIVVKRGDKIVTRSRMQITLNESKG
jgi:hypothetical protein